MVRCQMLYHYSMGFHRTVLDTVLFIVYVRSLASLLDAHGEMYHFYADATPFYRD